MIHFQDLSATIEVKTEPRGPPEAPVDVEVAEGPRDGTLLVSWLPVTINPSGTSNGAPVTGYAVYIDGKRVKEVDSGTADMVSVLWHLLNIRTPSSISIVQSLIVVKHTFSVDLSTLCGS